MSWETNRKLTPAARMASIRAAHFCWKKMSPTLSASSTIRSSGRRCANSAKPRRTRMPEE
jgi:hypothetical protein